MTLYDLVECISKAITPKTNSLYNYVLHTSDDDGGFLRTRYCYSDKPVKDIEIKNMDKAIVCFRKRFIEGDKYYSDKHNTLIKMQLFYYCNDIEEDIKWSQSLGYCVARTER